MLYDLEPEPKHKVELLLFRHVTNTSTLRNRLLKGEFRAAFLNASLVLDVFQALVAVSTALHRQERKTMATRNIFTEIVYNFSSTRNISKSLDRFGISAATQHVLVILPNPSNPDIDLVRNAVEGEEVLLIQEGLKQISDVAQIRNVYGIPIEEGKSSSLIDSVVTRMACRDVR